MWHHLVTCVRVCRECLMYSWRFPDFCGHWPLFPFNLNWFLTVWFSSTVHLQQFSIYEDSGALRFCHTWLLFIYFYDTEDEELQRVPGRFDSVEEYIRVFEPLLFEECRAQLYSTWEESQETASNHVRVCIKSVERRERGIILLLTLYLILVV